MIPPAQHLRITGRARRSAFLELQRGIMSKNDVNSFRRILEATVIELDNSMRRRDGIIIEGIGDEFDRMHTASECDLAIHTLEALSSRWRAALAALRRIEEGTYGICMEC